MIVTEQDASALWCVANVADKCCGSTCMAWEWVDGQFVYRREDFTEFEPREPGVWGWLLHRFAEKKPVIHPPIEGWTPNGYGYLFDPFRRGYEYRQPATNRQGRCGLAGVPRHGADE